MSDAFNDTEDMDDPTVSDSPTSFNGDSDDDLFDDFEVDFDKVDLPETDLPFIIQEVVYEEKRKEDGTPNRLVTVKMKVDGSDYDFLAPYHDRWHTETIWLGHETMAPLGVKRFQSFVEAATGQKPEGKLRWSDYGFVRDAGTKRGRLTYLHGNSVGGQMVKERGSDGVDRIKVKVWKNAENLKPLSPEELDNSANF